MESKDIPRWLEWAREIQALAQTGKHYAENEYQVERYQRLLQISAEIIEQHSELDDEELVRIFTRQVGYATPRVDVRGVVFQNGELLMVRERMDNGWTMPGGWADVGDFPSEAVEREVFEESGYRVKVQRMVGIYDANRFGTLEVFHAYKIVFLCNIIGGEARTSNETTEVAFFSLNEIPEPLSAERTPLRVISHAFAAYGDEHWQVVFD
ncbi:MAG: NUDIX hydrolase N-terminal domain-containing protein [Chloroflexota bacterium]|nr:NUDIX hydrolase N-terminal domain-containing protein [Chloroflexota bacterium]